MGRDPGFLYLSEDDLGALNITTAETIGAIETAVAAKADGKVWTAPKAAIVPGDGRYLMATLAAAEEPRIAAVKSVISNPRNAERGLPAINGAIVLLDSDSGTLRAVLDAKLVTAVRTAGLSAAVAMRLANPRSTSVGFVGCGVQALSHLNAFADIFPLTEVRAFGRGQRNIDRLCAAAREKGLSAHQAASATAALEDVDLVVSSITVTYQGEPFLDARIMKKGAFAAVTDLAVPWIPDAMPAFHTIIIDDRDQEAAMAKPMVEPTLVRGDLSDLLSGGIEAGFSPDRRSAFVFRGIAIGDLALASLAYSRAVEAGKGVHVGG